MSATVSSSGWPDVTTNLTPNLILKDAIVTVEQEDKMIARIVGTLNEVKYAEQLKTARKINDTAFDGTTDITTSKWGTARNIYVSDADGTNTGAAVSVNGGANATLKLPATIKATVVGSTTTSNSFQDVIRNGKVTNSAFGNAGTNTYSIIYVYQ